MGVMCSSVCNFRSSQNFAHDTGALGLVIKRNHISKFLVDHLSQHLILLSYMRKYNTNTDE